MTKIYIVTIGEYEDYRIVGAFSTRELAEKCANAIQAREVEVYDVDSDEVLGLELGEVYTVSVDLESGRVIPVTSPQYTDIRHKLRHTIGFHEYRGFMRNPYVRVQSPISRDHAQCVCNEMRRRWFNNNKTWNPDWTQAPGPPLK